MRRTEPRDGLATTPDEYEQADLPATISVRLAGRLLGVCAASAYEAARTGQLPVLRLGARRMLVPTARLRELLGCTAAELAGQIAAVDADAHEPAGAV